MTELHFNLPKGYKLKPCPFCGGEATLKKYRFAFCHCQVVCYECGISTMSYEGENADEEAIKAWNRRVE